MLRSRGYSKIENQTVHEKNAFNRTPYILLHPSPLIRFGHLSPRQVLSIFDVQDSKGQGHNNPWIKFHSFTVNRSLMLLVRRLPKSFHLYFHDVPATRWCWMLQATQVRLHHKSVVLLIVHLLTRQFRSKDSHIHIWSRIRNLSISILFST